MHTMKIKTTFNATLVAALSIISMPITSAEEVKPPVKEVKSEERKEAVKHYKFDTCIVSDEKLGEMGKPYVFTHEGQEIKMCCKNCKGKFDKDPALYLKKLEVK